MRFTSLVVLFTLAGAPKVDEKRGGTWLAGQTPFVTFNANGAMEDGKVKWSSGGRTLVVTHEAGSADALGYTVAGASPSSPPTGSSTRGATEGARRSSLVEWWNHARPALVVDGHEGEHRLGHRLDDVTRARTA